MSKMYGFAVQDASSLCMLMLVGLQERLITLERALKSRYTIQVSKCKPGTSNDTCSTIGLTCCSKAWHASPYTSCLQIGSLSKAAFVEARSTICTCTNSMIGEYALVHCTALRHKSNVLQLGYYCSIKKYSTCQEIQVLLPYYKHDDTHMIFAYMNKLFL